MTIREAVSTIDTVWSLRKKPLGWLILAAAGIVLGLAAWDKATAGAAWVQKVEKHVETHDEEQRRLEWKVDVLREGQQQQGRDIRDIRNAVMQSK